MALARPPGAHDDRDSAPPAAGPRDEGAQQRQEAVRRVQGTCAIDGPAWSADRGRPEDKRGIGKLTGRTERAEEGQALRVHHLQQEPEAQAEVR